MPSKIVLVTIPFDQGDILRDFLDWHLELGIDVIVAMDGGSTDGSREVLAEYATRTSRVVWLPLPEADLTKYAVGDELAAIARDRYGADWIILADVDEFICTTGSDLRTALAEADAAGIAQVKIPRRTMTGPPLAPNQRPLTALTLRIDRTVDATVEECLSGDLSVPFVFIEVGPHVAVRASAFDTYGPGAHVASTTAGHSETSKTLYFLHYAIRDFESLRTKVENTKAWLAVNQHLPYQWGWHWRRWIRLNDEGRLRDDYDAQFFSETRAQQLIDEGACAIDRTVADWIAKREARSSQDGLSSWRQWVSQALRPFRAVSSR